MPYDWRPPTDADWTRLRTLLRDVLVHLEGDADLFDQAEQDLRTVGGKHMVHRHRPLPGSRRDVPRAGQLG
jgi:hypothetical protein